MGQLCCTNKQVNSLKKPSKEEQIINQHLVEQRKHEKKIFQHFKQGYSNEYVLVENLDKSGSVLLVQNHVTLIPRVARVFNKSAWVGKEDQLINLLKLVSINPNLKDHTHLSKIYEIFWEHEYVYIIEEYHPLGQFIKNYSCQGNKVENYVALIMKSLLSAICYLHSFGIVHGQINYENIVVNENCQLKLVGYGFELPKPIEAVKFNPPSQKTLFQSPEVLSKYIKINYFLSDVWACGVFMHALLTGHDAFSGLDEVRLQKAVMRGMINFNSDDWRCISKDAQNFLQNLLTYKQSDRPTAQQMLQDGWLSIGKKVQRGRKIPKRVFRELRRQQHLSVLQQASMQFLINNVLDQKERDNLIQQFEYIDTNGDGLLSREELLTAFKKKMKLEDAITFVDSIFDLIDTDHSGSINYSEYVCAVFNKRQLFTEEKLDEAFQLLDRDHSGWLSYEEIKKLLISFNMPPSQIKIHIKEMDKDGDGKITVDEFKDILRVAKRKSSKVNINQLMKQSQQYDQKTPQSALKLKIQDSDISTVPSVGRSPNNKGKTQINKRSEKSVTTRAQTGGKKAVAVVKVTQAKKHH